MFFLIIFYVFSSTKSANRRAEQVKWGWGGGTSGRGRWQGQGLEEEYNANNVYTCM
jgi:hypothetical protein